MKTKLLIFFFLLSLASHSQSFKVSYSFDGKNDVANLDTNVKIEDPEKKDNFTTVYLRIDGTTDSKKNYQVFKGDQQLLAFKNDGKWHAINYPDGLFDKELEIREIQKKKYEKLEFTFQYDGEEPQEDISQNIYDFLREYISEKRITSSKLGLKDEKDAIHIFIDQFGNSLNSTIPQGIPYFQYYVHVIYLDSKTKPNYIYSIDQSKGSIDSGLFIENPNAGKFKPESLSETVETLVWHINETALQSSNKDNIEFEINRTTIKEGTKTKIGAYSIKMAPTFHSTINVGLYVSQLENPDFTLVDLGNSTSTVKKSLEGSNGIITATATLYTSPIILLESLMEKDKEKKKALLTKASTRCYINDHDWYERIYPTVGVKLGDKAFENLFAGFSFEIARGASIFLGGNYGKVNYFEGDFDYGIEIITQQQFDLRQKEKWDWDFAYGINLDLRIITSLFGQ